jgi:TetR/AcrR family transcriptional regulator, mexJK operon transcriptional repressor
MAVTRKQFFSRDPEAVTERILDAAESEFVSGGYAGASTNRILEGFGGSKATLFRHYPTKAQLFIAVIRRIEQRLVAAVDWAAIDSDDPQIWLTNFARIALHASLSDDALFVGRMVVAHGHAFPVLRKTFTAIALQPILSRLTIKLRHWTSEGTLSCNDPEADSLRFFDLVTSGWTLRALFGIGPAMTRRLAECEPHKAVMVFLEGRLPRNGADDA